jgi:hypothetical protein
MVRLSDTYREQNCKVLDQDCLESVCLQTSNVSHPFASLFLREKHLESSGP